LQGGQRWEAVVDEQLLAANAIVVLWTAKSVQSDWVRHEASIAKARAILVPARLEECVLPSALAGVHTIDLKTWDGSERDPRFRDLVGAISGLLRKRRHAVLARIAAVVGLLLAGTAFAVARGRTGITVNDRLEAVKSPPSSPSPSRGDGGAAPSAATTAAASDFEAASKRTDAENRRAQMVNALVASKQFKGATQAFAALCKKPLTGPGYIAFTDAVYAFDQLGDDTSALRVLDVVRGHVVEDAWSGFGFWGPEQSRNKLRKELADLVPQMKSANVKHAVKVLVHDL